MCAYEFVKNNKRRLLSGNLSTTRKAMLLKNRKNGALLYVGHPCLAWQETGTLVFPLLYETRVSVRQAVLADVSERGASLTHTHV